MEIARLLQCAEVLHGHPCPPLVLGLRAGLLAMTQLGVSRAAERELFAMVELGSDHYAQGFADGVQVATGCSFGKERIARVPMGKLGMTLVDQRTGRAVRVVARSELLDGLESTEWFRRCAERCAPWTDLPEGDIDPLVDFLVDAGETALFSASAIFPMQLEDAPPHFATEACDVCGESVLSPYARMRNGARLCIRCDERRDALGRR